MVIGGTPNTRLPKGRRERSAYLPFPLNGKCSLFFSARYALYQAIPCLGLAKGDEILVPSYCCGTEVDPLLARGLKPVWYAVDREMKIDLNDIGRRYHPGIRAILVTHYLGFNALSHGLLDFVRARHMILIEDCAHAFLSGTADEVPLGALADASVFSLRKSLPCPDGAALHLQEEWSTDCDLSQRPPNRWSVFFRECELMAADTAGSEGAMDATASLGWRLTGKALLSGRLAFRATKKLLGKGGEALVHPNTYAFVDSAVDWSMSKWSQRRLGRMDWRGIYERRRQNYEYLSKNLPRDHGVRLLREALPDGCCPLFFPVLLENRQSVRKLLRMRGIDSHDWWGFFHSAVPWDEFPDAVALKRGMLGLPVHQDLGECHMERIVAGFGAVMAQVGRKEGQ